MAATRSLLRLANVLLLVGMGLHFGVAGAQLSLSSAVDLALRNDPRVHAAQADVDKAKAALSETHDVYIPAVDTGGGYGKSTGVPLGLPVIFTIESQSLIYSASQPDYIRSAQKGLLAAQDALHEARNVTVEDTVHTYVTLDNALRRRTALEAERATAGRLVVISTERSNAGLEASMELKKNERTAAGVHLQQLLVGDEIDALADRLSDLTGVPMIDPETVPASIPSFPAPGDYDGSKTESPGITAGFLQAEAQQSSARGERRYLFRPQVVLSIGYSRVTASDSESNYGVYYPQFLSSNIAANHLSLNALSIGFQISIPLIDYLHRAKARELTASAAHAFAEAQTQKMLWLEGRHKLRHAAAELSVRAQIAALDSDLADQQLAAVRAQLAPGAADAQTTQLSPEDESKALLDVGSKQVDALNAELQLRQTEVQLMDQDQTLADWLHRAVTANAVSASPQTH
jgi:outer membrane protein TolC